MKFLSDSAWFCLERLKTYFFQPKTLIFYQKSTKYLKKLKNIFSASPGKAMQNHLEISSKSQFWIRHVEIGGKYKETHFFKYIFTKNVIFGLQIPFVDGFNVLMSFLAEK